MVQVKEEVAKEVFTEVQEALAAKAEARKSRHSRDEDRDKHKKRHKKDKDDRKEHRSKRCALPAAGVGRRQAAASCCNVDHLIRLQASHARIGAGQPDPGWGSTQQFDSHVLLTAAS